MENVRIRPKLLFRKRIFKILSEISNIPLIFILAPRGYGKTTAVKEYIDHEKNDADIV